MNVSIIIAVCYYIVLIAQFGIMWKAKNPGENEIFSITVPNEKLENEEIKGVQKKYMTMLGIFTVIFVAAPAVMFGTDNGTVQGLGCECQSKNIESRTSLYGWMFPSTDR